MFASLFGQFVSLVLRTIHLWFYASNGSGVQVLDILSKIFNGTSECSMSMLLIALANGWTILYQNVDIDDRLEIFIPITAFTVMVHVMVSALTFVDVDANHKYHDFAGIQGWVMMVCKLALFATLVCNT
jgi:hypothetical protein